MTPATPPRPNATQIPCFMKPKHKCNQAYNNLAHWRRGGLRRCIRKRILIWGYGSGIFRNSNFWLVFWVKFGLIWGETRYRSAGRKLDILWIHPPPVCSPPCINNPTQTQIVCTDQMSQPAAAHRVTYVSDIAPRRRGLFMSWNS